MLWGYSMTGGDGFAGVVGNPFAGVGLYGAVGTEDLVDVGFGATFAIITVALISGAVADRATFGTWCVFVPIWVTLVYCPMAFMVWGGELLGADGAIGSVVIGLLASQAVAVLFALVFTGVMSFVIALALHSETAYAFGFGIERTAAQTPVD